MRKATDRQGRPGPDHGQAATGGPDGPGADKRAGAAAAGVELAKLVVEVDAGGRDPGRGVLGRLGGLEVVVERPVADLGAGLGADHVCGAEVDA